MGTVYIRGRMYYINITENGRRIRRKVGPSREVAELVLKDCEVKIARRQFNLEVSDCTLSELFEAFEVYSTINHAKSTTLRYQQVVNNFWIFLRWRYPSLVKASQLSQATIEEFKHFRRTVDPRDLPALKGSEGMIKANHLKGRTRTVNYELKTLASILRFGIKRKMCSQNPCDGVQTLRVTDTKPQRILTVHECQRLLSAANGVLKRILVVFMNTGLRLGELLNLEWEDIDFDRATISIRHKVDWGPKSRERDVPLNQACLIALCKQRDRSEVPSRYVFADPNGGKLKRRLRKDLISIANKAGIEGLTRIHSLRHTFASQLIMNGVDLPSVQQLLGHADIQTTMIYSHLSDKHLRSAVTKIQKLS